MLKRFIDLHTHTIYSDGTFTPEQLLNKAKAYGLVAISITDHDTVKAYSPQLFNLADKLEIELVPGVEFSTRDEDSNKYHILGLLIDLNSADLNNLTNLLNEDRIKEASLVCDLLNSYGWEIDREMLFNEPGTITKAHISRAVLGCEKNRTRLIKEFGKVPTEGSFCEAWLIKGKPAYVSGQRHLHPKQAIETIKNAKGLAILAHPSFNIMAGEDFNSLCNKFINWGIDGFEAINVQYDRSNGDVEVQHIDEFTKFAREKGLVISGGSDFHHDDESLMGKFIDLGFRNYSRKVPYSVLEELKLAQRRSKTF
ncbi:MAG: PHP domain-containing protein [Patescibacteria group bacterium]|nr:PHP domain-containing protein [Patescibacteria group bacterium]